MKVYVIIESDPWYNECDCDCPNCNASKERVYAVALDEQIALDAIKKAKKLHGHSYSYWIEEFTTLEESTKKDE